MNITKNIDTGAIASELKIKIRQIRLKTIICPAVIFANNRIISANGFENKSDDFYRYHNRQEARTELPVLQRYVSSRFYSR